MKNRLILLALAILLCATVSARVGSKSLSAHKLTLEAEAHSGLKAISPLTADMDSGSKDEAVNRSSTVFHETFETNSASLSGWSQIHESGTRAWTYTAGSSGGSVRNAYSGSRNARFTSSNGGPHITKLVSPVLNLAGYQNGNLSFWYAQERSNQGQNQLKVYYRTGAAAPWTQLAHYTSSLGSWTQASLNLPNLSAAYQIAFEGIDNRGHANVIDEVTVSALIPPISSFPFSETFEADSATRNRWTQIIESGTIGWSLNTGSSGGSITTAHSGTINARFTSTSGGPFVAKLISPILDLSAYTNAEMSFWYAQEAWEADQNELKVYYRTSASSPWNQIAHYTQNISQWTQVSLFLPNVSSSYQIAFEGIDNWGRANVIDDITINPYVETISSFPFQETFEDDSATRNRWTQIQTQGSKSWSFASGSSGGSVSSAYGGTLNARFTSSSGGPHITKLVSPVFDLSSLTYAGLSFVYAQEFWSPDQNELKVYYRTSGTMPWQLLAHFDSNVSQWSKVTLGLPNPSSFYQIAFEGIDNYGYANVLDNVTVEYLDQDPELAISADKLNFPLLALDTDSTLSFKIRNNGGGYLVLNSAPSISGMDAAHFQLIDQNSYPISLMTGHVARYQVKYSPFTSGTHKAHIQIPYQGDHQVDLNGRAGNLIFSDNFDSYSDFSLDLAPWTQYDGDALSTYGINNVTFTNQYYTGSFIAFNPNTTSPALSNHWAAHSGTKYAAAFAANGGPNNDWLISPAISFGDNPVLSFMAKSLTDEYGLERIKVMYSTTGNSFTDFHNYLEGSQSSYTEVPTEWTEFVYDLPIDCANTTVYIAIQCVSDDAFALMIDSFRAFGDYYPSISVDPPAYEFPPFYPLYHRYQVFNISNTGAGLLRIREGDISIQGDSEFQLDYLPAFPIELQPSQSTVIRVSYYPTASGTFTATLNITDNFGKTKSIALSATTKDNLISRFPHIEGFEGSDVEGWVSRDEDGDGRHWQLLSNSSTVEYSYTGNNCIISRSWVPDETKQAPLNPLLNTTDLSLRNSAADANAQKTGSDFGKGPLDPDNWLITPRLQLSSNTQVSWRVAAQHPSWAAEHYSVLISTTTPDPAAFSTLFSETLVDDQWQYRTLNLSAYTGQTVYLAFRHHDSYDQFLIKLDTVKFFTLNSDTQYGLSTEGIIDISMDPIFDTARNIQLNVRFHGEGFAPEDILDAEVSFDSPAIDLPNAGLMLILRGASFSGVSLEIFHDLGFSPMQAFWRIQPGSWNLLTSLNPAVYTWNDSTLAFMMPNNGKLDGDFQIVFPRTKDDTLPVTLTAFVASLIHNGKVKLSWTTASETGVLGFTVLRSEFEDISGAIAVSPLIEATNSSTQQVYEFQDSETMNQSRYYYWLLCRDFDGSEAFYGPISIHTSGSSDQGDMIPKITKNLGNYPNPFNPSTTLRYSLANAGKATLRIFNARGQLLRTQINEHNRPGTYQWVFDGKDDIGRELTSGVYFYRFESGNHSSTHRMLLLK